MFLLCTVSPTSPLQNLFYYYILVLSTLYIRHTPSIYPYYILDICIDIPSIFIPNTYSILNTSHTLTHPVKDAQSDKEKKKCNCPYPSLHKHPYSTMIWGKSRWWWLILSWTEYLLPIYPSPIHLEGKPAPTRPWLTPAFSDSNMPTPFWLQGSWLWEASL